MKPDDLADATARALDLLPPDDLAFADPRLARDPRLVEESRLTREAAAQVWLAVSPLHVAPPEVLHAVLGEIRPLAVKPSRSMPWLAASGWAAAVVVAFLLWPGPVSRRAAEQTTPPAVRNIPAKIAPARVPVSRETRLPREIVRLQDRLAAVGKHPAAVPRVIGLHAPGTPRRTPEEERERVRSILTAALRSALEAESGAPGDPADLVIERGWPVPQDAGVIRHRHFPVASWQELGLLRSAAGGFYDPASQTVWTPDADGKSFLGRKITVEDDLAGFTREPDPAAPPAPQPRTAPEGFIIENSAERSAEVVIDQLPAPGPGTEHVIVLTDASGNTTTVPVPETATDSGQTLFHNTSTGFPDYVQFAGSGLTAGTLFLPLVGVNGVTNFQLVERPLGTGGSPGRVIVEGGP